jgi:plastocyanin
MRNRIVRLVVVLATLALVGAACNSSSSSSTASGGGTTPSEQPSSSESSSAGTPTPTTLDGQQANFVKQEDATGQSSIEIEADTDDNVNYFSPTVITGTAGQQITIELKNESDSVKHNFTIESLHINQDLDPGQSASVTVTLPSSGTLEFHCEYHESVGMLGEFTVGA